MQRSAVSEQQRAVSIARRPAAARSAARAAHAPLHRSLLTLQRCCGNQVVGQLLRQASGAPVGGARAEVVERTIADARGGGQGMDPATRGSMESAFGADFSGVRIHHDARADDLSQTLGARAFTTGSDVFFRRGEYDPGASSGRELLAHELTHVVQQDGGAIARKASVGEPGDAQELEADRVARQVVERESRDSKNTDAVDDVGPLDVKAAPAPLGVARAVVASGATTVQRLTAGEKTENLQSAKFAGNPQLENAFDNAPVLGIGAKGDGVRLVQEALVADGFPMPISTRPDGSMDGDFGSETASVVSKFQTKHGLGRDGRVGRDTMRRLDELSGGDGKKPPAPVPAPPVPGPTPPPAPPPPPPPPVVPVAVSIATVRAPSTPTAMAADRIPPRVDTDVAVKVAGAGAPAAPVTLSVAGAGGGNGTVTLDGAATVNLTADKTVKVRGGTQTAKGNGGKLKLIARQGTGPQLAASNAFTVSAIPQNYADTFVSLVTGALRGIVVQDDWKSDSLTFTDLDETEISERVEVKSSSGCLAGFASGNSGYEPGNVLTRDTHSTRVSTLTGDGDVFTHQTCMFKDHRTGAVDIPMTASGFHLKRHSVAPVPAGSGPVRFTMSKVGAAATAKGIASSAGVANVVKTQDV